MIEAKTIKIKIIRLRSAVSAASRFDPDALAYAAVDSNTGELLAVSQFRLCNDGFGELVDVVATPDLSEKAESEYSLRNILFITGRAAMNFMDICGFHKARAVGTLSRDEALAKLLGFKPDPDGGWFCDLAHLFTGEHC